MRFADGMSEREPSSSQHASPGRFAATTAILGPPFDASLRDDQIKSHVLEVLKTMPRSISPLDLSKILWPEASRDIRSGMRVRVSQPLHGLKKEVKHVSKPKLEQQSWCHMLTQPVTPLTSVDSLHCSCTPNYKTHVTSVCT